MKTVNRETGEIITEESPLVEISNARKELAMEINALKLELKELDDFLADSVEKAVENEETTFCDYWTIVRGRNTFSKKVLKEKNPDRYKKYTGLEEELKVFKKDPEYMVSGKPYLKFPKIS